MLWVKHTFRARFGVWVEDAGTDLMQYPDADVIAFSLDEAVGVLARRARLRRRGCRGPERGVRGVA